MSSVFLQYFRIVKPKNIIDMRQVKIKQFALLLGLMLPAIWCGANNTNMVDGHSAIQVKEARVQGMPKGSSIQASINGHVLTVFFSENLGQVSIEVTTATGTPMDCLSTQTPTGVNLYVPHAGDYIITFTLPNGDEYYGEFTVTD